MGKLSRKRPQRKITPRKKHPRKISPKKKNPRKIIPRKMTPRKTLQGKKTPRNVIQGVVILPNVSGFFIWMNPGNVTVLQDGRWMKMKKDVLELGLRMGLVDADFAVTKFCGLCLFKWC